LKKNSIKTLSRGFIKFTSLIVAVLSCFDRVNGPKPNDSADRFRLERPS